jgi:hypothetical protein
MTNISRWFSPFNPRGMALWGSLACFVLMYGLYGIQGQLIEVWPNRCSLIKSQLLSVLDTSQSSHPLNITFSGPSNRDDYWTFSQEDRQLWLIPKREYKSARIRLNRMKPIWIELISDDQLSTTIVYETDRAIKTLYQYLTRMSNSVRHIEDFDTAVIMKSLLEEQSFRIKPQSISCERDLMRAELPKLLSLMLKAMEVGLKRVDYWEKGLWVTHRDVLGRQHSQVRRWTSTQEHEKGVWSISWAHGDQQSATKANSLPPWLTTLLITLDELESSPQNTDLLSHLPAEVKVLK